MNLYEKLNRLDDSLVESKRVVKKKKLTESIEDNKKKLFDAAASVKCKLDDDTIEYAMYDVDDFIENELVYCGKLLLSECPDMLFWRYVSDENFGSYCAVYESDEEFADAYYQISHDRVYDITDEVKGDYDYDDDIDEMLTESTEEYELSTLVKDSINHLVNNLGKDPMADDFGDDVCADLEDNYDIYVPQNPVKYADWCDAVMSEVSRQLNNKDEQLKEGYFNEMTEFMNWIQDYRNGALWNDFTAEFESEQDPDIDAVLDWLEMFDETAYYDYVHDDIDEKLTENRNSHYSAPYGYKDAAMVLNRKAPEYYYHRDEIQMAEGDGIKLARYAMKKGLPVMIYKYSDPDYPEFAIKDEYHWDDYFYFYPTAHEEDFVTWDGKMFVEEQLTEGNNVSSQLPPAIDDFLQDIAQMYKTITYKDIMEHEYTEEDLKKLKNYRRKFRAEIPYEGDEEADAILKNISEKVALIVKR